MKIDLLSLRKLKMDVYYYTRFVNRWSDLKTVFLKVSMIINSSLKLSSTEQQGKFYSTVLLPKYLPVQYRVFTVYNLVVSEEESEI